MKAKLIAAIPTVLAACALFGMIVAASPEPDDPNLLAKAKITRTGAEKILHQHFPASTIGSSKLHDHAGAPCWIVEVTTPGKSQSDRVEVNAVDGSVTGGDAALARANAANVKTAGVPSPSAEKSR